MTATPDRIKTTRRVEAAVALDTAPLLAARVVKLLSHGRRMTTARRYVDHGTTPEVHAGLTPSQEPTIWAKEHTAGVGVRLDRPGHLHGFGFSAARGVNDAEATEWARYHRLDRQDLTCVEIVGGLENDGPARDDQIVIKHWNSNGVEIETVIAFDAGPDPDTIDRDKLHAAVDEIPGSADWWVSGNGETYRGLADKLVVHGLTGEQALEVLEAAYGAAAGEFGS